MIKFNKRPCKGPDAPTVQDVIDALMLVGNKKLPVFGYLGEDSVGGTLDIIELNSIDTSMDDRIDINLSMSE